MYDTVTSLLVYHKYLEIRPSLKYDEQFFVGAETVVSLLQTTQRHLTVKRLKTMKNEKKLTVKQLNDENLTVKRLKTMKNEK